MTFLKVEPKWNKDNLTNDAVVGRPLKWRSAAA